MKITRRAPRITIFGTTYTFGKKGISTSTKIAPGVRVGTTADGRGYVGGGGMGYSWRQYTDESMDEVPLLGRLFGRKDDKMPLDDYSADVQVFKQDGDSIRHVTSGVLTLTVDRITVSANVTKEILYRDITDVREDGSKVFVSSQGRAVPLVVASQDAAGLAREIRKRAGER